MNHGHLRARRCSSIVERDGIKFIISGNGSSLSLFQSVDNKQCPFRLISELEVFSGQNDVEQIAHICHGDSIVVRSNHAVAMFEWHTLVEGGRLCTINVKYFAAQVKILQISYYSPTLHLAFCSSGLRLILSKDSPNSCLSANVWNQFQCADNFILAAESIVSHETSTIALLSDMGTLKFFKGNLFDPYYTARQPLLPDFVSMKSYKDSFWCLSSTGYLSIHILASYIFKSFTLTLESAATCFTVSRNMLSVGLESGSVQLFEWARNDGSTLSGKEDPRNFPWNAPDVNIRPLLQVITLPGQGTVTSILTDPKTNYLLIGTANGGLHSVLHDPELRILETPIVNKRNNSINDGHRCDVPLNFRVRCTENCEECLNDQNISDQNRPKQNRPNFSYRNTLSASNNSNTIVVRHCISLQVISVVISKQYILVQSTTETVIYHLNRSDTFMKLSCRHPDNIITAFDELTIWPVNFPNYYQFVLAMKDGWIDMACGILSVLNGPHDNQPSTYSSISPNKNIIHLYKLPIPAVDVMCLSGTLYVLTDTEIFMIPENHEDYRSNVLPLEKVKHINICQQFTVKCVGKFVTKALKTSIPAIHETDFLLINLETRSAVLRLSCMSSRYEYDSFKFICEDSMHYQLQLNSKHKINRTLRTWSTSIKPFNCDFKRCQINSSRYRDNSRRPPIDFSCFLLYENETILYFRGCTGDTHSIPLESSPVLWKISESNAIFMPGVESFPVTVVLSDRRIRIYHVVMSDNKTFLDDVPTKFQEVLGIHLGCDIQEVFTSSVFLESDTVSVLTKMGNFHVFRVIYEALTYKPAVDITCPHQQICEGGTLITASQVIEISKTDRTVTTLWVQALESGEYSAFLANHTKVGRPVTLATNTEDMRAKQIELFRIDHGKYNCVVLHSNGTLLSLRIKIKGKMITLHQQKEVVASVPRVTAFCKIHPEREHYAVAGEELEIVKFY